MRSGCVRRYASAPYTDEGGWLRIAATAKGTQSNCRLALRNGFESLSRSCKPGSLKLTIATVRQAGEVG